jgi:hypothetical protein
MLDTLRDQASFKDDEIEPPDPNAPKPPKQRKPRRSFDQITHMNASQRFILALLFSVVVCLLGVMLLMFSGKVSLPFQF